MRFARRATAWPVVEPPAALSRARSLVGGEAGPPALRAGTLYRHVSGVDAEPAPVPAAETERLGDPMGALLRQGRFPLTAADLLVALDEGGSLPRQESYLVGEAGQIPPEEAPALRRDLRFVVTRSASSDADLLVSTSAVDPPDTAFLQVAAWDEDAGLFNYYARLGATWVWSGNSYHALAAPSRGKGCFDSHVNGSLVMKELRQPWLNWDSTNATIVVAPDDLVLGHPLYTGRAGAEQLEVVVRAGVSRWTRARLAAVVGPTGRVEHVEHLLRQLCTTTTVNLATSVSESGVFRQDPSRALVPPLGFWLNNEALLDDLAIPADFTLPSAPGQIYLDSLERFGFALAEDDFRRPGDSHFAFAVPEAGFEDVDVVRHMVAAGLLSARFAASALMVDFPNPVFSPRRAALLAHVPEAATLDPAGGGLSDQIAAAVAEAAEELGPESPESELMANLALTEASWRVVFAARIQDFMAAVTTRCATVEGFDDYVRLAESRRREFKQLRLNEFSLTLPVTNIAPEAPFLHMNPDATVTERPQPATP